MLFSSSAAPAFDGPLQIKNQFPLFLYVDVPYLETASLEDSFSVSLSHSSVYLVDNSSKWDMGLDMEITELDLRLKKNIHDFIELGVDCVFRPKPTSHSGASRPLIPEHSVQ